MAIKIKKESGPENPKLVFQDIQIISVDRSMKDIRSFRNALRNAEAVYYPNRTRLYDLYEDTKLDGHLTGLINKRIDAVINKNIEFIDAAGKKVDDLEPLMESEVFYELMTEIMQTKFWGLTGLEFERGEEVSFKVVPRKHVRPEAGLIVINQSDQEGVAYDKESNLFVIGKDRDFGLLLQCSIYAIIKKGNFGDWAQYVEIFGQPMRVAKYSANDIKTKNELTNTLREAGGSLALVIPREADFDIKDGKASNGNGELQEKLKNACNDEMSVIILGNTETTSNSNGGSNAKAQEHGKQQLQTTKSDMRFLLGKLNSKKMLSILASYGLPVEGGKFRFEKETDLAALKDKIGIDTVVAEQVPVGDDYWYDTYQVPKPENYNELKAERAAKAAAAAAQPEELAEPSNPPDRPEQKKRAPKKRDKKETRGLTQLLRDFFFEARKG